MKRIKKFADTNPDLIEKGEITFVISSANESRLRALCKYNAMLDYITHSEECATVDGLINSLLESAMTKRIGELYKRHGFDSSCDFVGIVNACNDGAEVRNCIIEAENVMYKREQSEILSHTPIPDLQNKFDFAK